MPVASVMETAARLLGRGIPAVGRWHERRMAFAETQAAVARARAARPDVRTALRGEA